MMMTIRALAQKLSVKMEETYSSGQLVEINSHSLFSKVTARAKRDRMAMMNMMAMMMKMTHDDR